MCSMRSHHNYYMQQQCKYYSTSFPATIYYKIQIQIFLDFYPRNKSNYRTAVLNRHICSKVMSEEQLSEQNNL